MNAVVEAQTLEEEAALTDAQKASQLPEPKG